MGLRLSQQTLPRGRQYQIRRQHYLICLKHNRPGRIPQIIILEDASSPSGSSPPAPTDSPTTPAAPPHYPFQYSLQTPLAQWPAASAPQPYPLENPFLYSPKPSPSAYHPWSTHVAKYWSGYNPA